MTVSHHGSRPRRHPLHQLTKMCVTSSPPRRHPRPPHQLTALSVTSLLVVLIAVSAVAAPTSKTGDRVWLTSLPSNISFSCRGRTSGYYADVDSGCQMYHMCDPQSRRFSYLCPALTAFDQFYMTCVHHQRVNCSMSKQFYHMNEMIGKPKMKFHSDHNQGTTVSKKKETEGVPITNHVAAPSGQLLFEFETKLNRPVKRVQSNRRSRQPAGKTSTRKGSLGDENEPAAHPAHQNFRAASRNSGNDKHHEVGLKPSPDKAVASHTRLPIRQSHTKPSSKTFPKDPTPPSNRPFLPKTLTGPALPTASPTVALTTTRRHSLTKNTTALKPPRTVTSQKRPVSSSDAKSIPVPEKAVTDRSTQKPSVSHRPSSVVSTRSSPKPSRRTTKAQTTTASQRKTPTTRSPRQKVFQSSIAPRITTVPPAVHANQTLPQNTYKTVPGSPGSFSFGTSLVPKTSETREKPRSPPSVPRSTTKRPQTIAPRTVPVTNVTTRATSPPARLASRQSTTARVEVSRHAAKPRPLAAPTTPQTTPKTAKTSPRPRRTSTAKTIPQSVASAPEGSRSTTTEAPLRSRTSAKTTASKRLTTSVTTTHPPTAKTAAKPTDRTPKPANTRNLGQKTTTGEPRLSQRIASANTNNTAGSDTNGIPDATDVVDTPIPVRVFLRGGQKQVTPNTDLEALKISLTLQLPRVVEEPEGPREHVDMKVRGELITGEMALRKLMVDELNPTYYPSPSVPLNLLPPLMSQKRLQDGSSTTTLAVPFRGGRPTAIEIQTGSPEDGSLQKLDWLLPPVGPRFPQEPSAATPIESTPATPTKTAPKTSASPTTRQPTSQTTGKTDKNAEKLTMKFGKTKKAFHARHAQGSKGDTCYPCMQAFLKDVEHCRPCVVIR